MKQSDRIVVIGVAIAATLLGNALLPFAMVHTEVSDGFVTAGMTGAVAAEHGLLAIWCALASQPRLVRVPLCCELLVASWCCLLLGMKFVPGEIEMYEAATVFVWGTTMFLGIQIPLWFVRIALRRRIGLRTETKLEGHAGRFSLRFLLLATAGVAALLALMKVALPEGNMSDTNFLWAIGPAAVWSVVSAAHCIPCVWIILSDRPSSQGSAAIFLFLAWAGSPVVVLMIIAALGVPAVDAGELLPLLYSLNMGTIGATLAGLYLLRLLDYRLLVAHADGSLEVAAEAVSPGGPPTTHTIDAPPEQPEIPP